jgi:hypothetical protein
VVVVDPTPKTVVSNVINPPTIVKLNTIVKIQGFMRGTTLFQWPWKCMVHPGVIWIISSGTVPIFSIIDNQ